MGQTRLGGFQLSTSTMVIVVAALIVLGFAALYFTQGFDQMRDALGFMNPRDLIPGIGGGG